MSKWHPVGKCGFQMLIIAPLWSRETCRADCGRIPAELALRHREKAAVLICTSMNASFYLVRLIRTLRSTSSSHKILTFMSLVMCRKRPEIARGHFRVWLLCLVLGGLVFHSFKGKFLMGCSVALEVPQVP